jgi:PAS domain S-box-containing protein
MDELTSLSAAIVDALDAPLLVVDRDLRVISCNKSFRRWAERLGHESSPVGSSLVEVVPFLSPLGTQDFENVFATGTSLVTEERIEVGGVAATAEVRKLPVWVNGEVVAVATVIRDVSQRRQLEDSLRLKDAAIELSASGIALCNLEGAITYANRAFVALWGCAEAQEIVEKPFGTLWQARETAESALAGLGARGAWSGELMARRLDGSLFAAHLSASFVLQENGLPPCVMAVVSDLSERLGMEEALADSEATLRTLLDINPDEVLLVDPDGHVLVANPAAAFGFDRPLGEILGRRLSDLLTHDEAELVKAHKDVAIRTGRTVRFEASASGRVRDYRICPIGDGRGGVTTLALFRQDVTERATSGLALREANRAQQALIDAAPFAIVGLSREGLVKLWNRAAERWFGWSEAEVIGHRFPAVPHEAEHGFSAILDRVLRGGPIQTAEVVYRRRSGKPIELMLSVGPVFGPNAEVADLVLVAADTTERNRMHGLLVDAQKMEAVGRLASGLAHDFNNLLQGILSLVEVLRIHPASSERIAGVARALQERAQQGAALTRHLMLLSRRVEPHIETLDLGKIVAEEVELLRTMLPANIAVEQEHASQRLEVLGDPEQLKQVVMNLAANAAAAMPDGGRLLLRTGRSGDGWVWLEVSDTGVGIPAAIQHRVFEPFFTTKDPGRSSGLGLTVVKDIVSRHQGRVRVTSREGEGSAFRIELPAVAEAETSVDATVPGRDAVAPGTGRGERVLLVEDETSARDGLREMLKMLGYAVTAVGSSEIAGLLPPEPAFDLLLADVMLPGAAGTDLAPGLKERWPALKVILMSGYTEDQTIRNGVGVGTVRFLQKPFDMTTLAREVRAALDDRPTFRRR